jgi:hypothetical protein
MSIGYDADEMKAKPEMVKKLPACCQPGGMKKQKKLNAIIYSIGRFRELTFNYSLKAFRSNPFLLISRLNLK